MQLATPRKWLLVGMKRTQEKNAYRMLPFVVVC